MSTIPRVFGCVTNFDTLFLEMEFISLVDEIQFMQIWSRHFCIRSVNIGIMSVDYKRV